MSLFDDIIKAIPENSNLRVRVRELETKVDVLESENASFKDDLREKDVKIAALQKVVDELTHEPDLHEIEIQIIKLLAQSSQTDEATIQHSLNVPYPTTVHHVARLKEMGYVCPVKVGATDFPHCALTKKGRALANDNHLIEYAE